MRAARLALLTLIATLLVGAAASIGGAARRCRLHATIRLAVMSQNIFYGGDDFDLTTSDWCPVANGCPQALHRLARIIEASGADVVGVQEPERNTRKLAGLLGWYASPQAHVISRFPILDPPGVDGLYAFVEPAPGRVVAVANIHLPSTPYGPYQVRKGWPRHDVLAAGATAAAPGTEDACSASCPKLAAEGIPVFLTGDFNSPSYLDWTAAVAAAGPRSRTPSRGRRARRWPKRGSATPTATPTPTRCQDPGFTWSPGGPETRPNDFSDRIDWVLHAGAVDHRLEPAGRRAAATRRSTSPSPSPIPPTTAAWCRPSTSHPPRRRSWSPPNGAASSSANSPCSSGSTAPGHRTRSWRSSGRRPRRCSARCRRSAGPTAWSGCPRRPCVRAGTTWCSPRRGRITARAPVWVYPPGERPRLRTDAASYDVGDAVRVHWTGAPGTQSTGSDCSAATGSATGAGSYLMYRYTRTRIEGSVVFGSATYLGEGSTTWPLPPGQYLARLLVDDSYHAIGKSARFTITR